ncbi:unnamed protein product [Closterium sp. NIES-54]
MAESESQGATKSRSKQPRDDIWLRVEFPGEDLSDVIRIRGATLGANATILDLKERLAETIASSGSESIPVHRVFVTLPAAPGAAGNAEEARQLSASDSLDELPEGAGGPKWPLIARVRGPAAAAAPAKPVPKKPQTLFEKGLAGKDEPPQIRNAMDMRDLYPGGVLPRSGIKDENLIIKILKLALVFALLVGIAAGAMYLLGEVLPKYYSRFSCPALQPACCTALPCPAARTPCSPRAALPCSPLAALWQPARRPFAALLALPCLHRPAAAAARATAAAGAGAARGGQRRSLPLPDNPTPQQLHEWVLQRARPGVCVWSACSVCSCRVLSHQTLLWHHRLGHPSLPCLRSMHSRLLVYGLPRSLPPLPRSRAPPCLPCVEGRQRAAPHSSEFPPTTAPLQTLHMDTFMLPASPQKNGIDERRTGLIMEVACTSMIHAAAPHFLWPFAVIRYAAHQLNLWPRVSEQETSPTLRWTGKVGDASVFRVLGALSLVRDAKASKLPSRTLRCVFLGFSTDTPPWQFYHLSSRRVFSSPDVTFDESVYYYRLHPHASNPGPAPSGVSQVDPPPLVEPLEITYDSCSLAEGGEPAADDTAATRCSPRLDTPPGFPPRLSSPPLQPASVDSGAETVGAEPGDAETEGEGSGGAATGEAATGGAATGGAAIGGVGSWGAGTGGADSGGPARPSGGGAVGDPTGGPGAGHPPQPDLLETLLPQTIRAWIVRQGSPGGGGYGPAGAGAASLGGTAPAGGTRGAAGAGGAGATSPGGTAGAGGTRGAGAPGPKGARTGGAGAARAGGAVRAGGAGGTAGARGAGAGGTGGTGGAGAAGPRGARTRGTGATGAGGAAGARGAGGATRALGFGGAGGTTGARGHGAAGASGAAGAGGAGGAGAAGAGGAGAAGTALSRPFFYPQPQSSLPPPHSVIRQTSLSHSYCLAPRCLRLLLTLSVLSSLPHVPDLESDLAHAASPTITRLLATIVTDPDLESTAAFALVTELVDFAARSRLDYVASLVTESKSICPPSAGGELALGSDVLEDRQFELECLAAALPRFASMLFCSEGDPDALDIPTLRSYPEAIAGEYSSQWQTAMDAEMASWKSTSTYVDEVPPLGANIVDGMWILRVKQLPGSPPSFKARYVAGSFSQRQGVVIFQTFSPTSKMTTLWVVLHLAAQRDYELHSLDFSTTFLHGSLHEEIWLRRPPGFTGLFPAGTQWSLRRPVYGLRQAPREWHNTLRTILAALGFSPSFANPSLFLRTDTTLPLFYVLVYVNDLVFATADTEALTLATQRSSQGYTFSLGSSSVSWRSTRSSSVLSYSCEAKIYAGAMAAQELRWLTYLLTDLGERPCSPPVLYVDNKAMLALCHEQRLEHRTKNIALRYCIARELEQRRRRER